MAKMKEYENAEYHGMDSEPKQSDMGASILNYGEQRFGAGVEGEEEITYAEPGEEGAEAIRLMREGGAWSSHEEFEGPMQGTPTGR